MKKSNIVFSFLLIMIIIFFGWNNLIANCKTYNMPPIHHERCCNPNTCNSPIFQVIQVRPIYQCGVYDSTRGICLMYIYMGCEIFIFNYVACEHLCYPSKTYRYNNEVDNRKRIGKK